RSPDGVNFERLKDIELPTPGEAGAARFRTLLSTPSGVVWLSSLEGAAWIVGKTPVSDLADAALVENSPGDWIVIGTQIARRHTMVRRAGDRPTAEPAAAAPTRAGPDGASEVADDADEPPVAEVMSDWPPDPDFENPVNYIEWLARDGRVSAPDDANAAYAEVL